MNKYISELVITLEKNRDPQKAKPMEAYMRNQFPYLGIKSPELSSLTSEFYSRNGLPPVQELAEILRDLWQLPEREYQYSGVGLLSRMNKKLPDGFISTIEYLLVSKPWWDTVDAIAGGTVGVHFQRFPDVMNSTLPSWRTSPIFWLRRSAILFQLNYKEKTDFVTLCQIIEENLGSKEFFINKAIGWSLRQYSKYNESKVREFVSKTNLHPLSKREALKWLERKANK